MINPNTFAPDFTVNEHIANNNSLHMIGFYHITPTTQAHFEAYKSNPLEETPYVSHSWETEWSARQAAEFMQHFDKLENFRIVGGKLLIVTAGLDNLSRQEEYDLVPDEEATPEDQAQPIEELIPANTCLVRLEAPELADFVWSQQLGDRSRQDMGVVTVRSLMSPWARDLYDKTVNMHTKPIIDRHLEQIVAALGAFVELPFGEPLLETGLSKV